MSLQPSPIPPIRGSSPIGVKTYGSVLVKYRGSGPRERRGPFHPLDSPWTRYLAQCRPPKGISPIAAKIHAKAPHLRPMETSSRDFDF